MPIADFEFVILAILAAVALLALAGLAMVLARTRRSARQLENLSDEAVLIAENGIVVEASQAARALVGEPLDQPLRALLTAFVGDETHAAADALDRLEDQGTAFDLLAEDSEGRPFEVAGRPRGGQIRLALRPADLLRAEHDRMKAEFADRAAVASVAAIEESVLSNLLAEAPILAWCRTEHGQISWSAGQIAAAAGVIKAEVAARGAAERAKEIGAGTAGDPDRFRLEIETEDGASGPLAVLDAVEVNGMPGTRLGLAIDGTGAADAEQALGRFERTMTDTFAHLHVGLAIFDRNQALAMFNPALGQMWQADPARLARRPQLRDILDDLRANRRIPEVADFHAWRQRLIGLFDDTEQADFDELWHLADGSDLRVLARPHPHGSIAFVFEDVSERLRLEQRFRHSIDLRRATLDRLDEGLAVFGPDGRLQLVNTAFHQIWGTDAETARASMHASELLPLIRGLTVETEVWERLMGFITSSECRQAWGARLTLGNERILSARFAALPDGATMAVFGDVTDTDRIALALRERNEALEAAEEMRAAMLDQVSHRLRTPLNTIFGFGQLIADSRFGELNEAQRGYADGIMEAAGHLLATVDEVTELAALNIDPLEDVAAGPALGDAILRTGQLLEKRAAEDGVTLIVTAPKAGCEPECDPGRLRQIVFGMITDALSRCRDGGEIRLGARLGEDGRVEIFTAESARAVPNPGQAQTQTQPDSLALPYLQRLVALEGGVFELRAVQGGLSAICTLAARNPEPTSKAADTGATG